MSSVTKKHQMVSGIFSEVQFPDVGYRSRLHIMLKYVGKYSSRKDLHLQGRNYFYLSMIIFLDIYITITGL